MIGAFGLLLLGLLGLGNESKVKAHLKARPYEQYQEVKNGVVIIHTFDNREAFKHDGFSVPK